MKYFEKMLPILNEAIETQEAILEKAADIITEAIRTDRLIYVFGAGHAGMMAEEMFYRAGGLAPVMPLFFAGLTTNVRPITLTTQLERMSGYAEKMIDEMGLESDAVLIVHSNSGKNSVPVEMALCAKKRGMTIIALTNKKQCNTGKSRQPDGIRLTDVADLVIDNCGVIGDACVMIDAVHQAVGPTSTVVGAALLNALMVEVSQKLVDQGVPLPVFKSANVEDNGYCENNMKWLEHYRGRLTYV